MPSKTPPEDLPPDLAHTPEGVLTETKFGLKYEFADLATTFLVVDLRRKSGELWGEVTVKCLVEGAKGQLDDALRQGNLNFSSIPTRKIWANSLTDMTPPAFNKKVSWVNLLERFCQAVLRHERGGAIHGHELVGQRATAGGKPWAAWPLIPHGETATLFARGGAGKTTLVALLAFSMALGRSLVPGVRVDRKYRPVILDWETNAETAEDTWGILSETYRIPVPKGVWYEPMDAPLERSLPKIANILEQHYSDLVIIDSVTMAMASSADGSGDPADSITRVYQSLRRLGAWGLLIDHIAGGDYRSRKAAMKAYGSIFKLNLARHAIALHIGNRTEDTSQAYLLCPKSNVGRDRWAMEGVNTRNDDEIRWSFGDLDYDLYDRLMSEVDQEEIPEARLASTKSSRPYLEFLGEVPAGRTPSELAAEFELSQAAARVALGRLARDGLVQRDDLGLGRGNERHWYLTDLGRGFIAQRGPVDD